MRLLSFLVPLSALLALTGAMPGMRKHRWHAFWPTPIMAVATGVGLRDVLGLLGMVIVGLPARSLVVGVWASFVVLLGGVAEIRVGWRGEAGGRAFVAPALLMAGGFTLWTPLLGSLLIGASPEPTAILAALLMVAAGALLAGERLWPIHRRLVRSTWPIALGLGAVVGSLPSRRERDPFIEARREIQSLEGAWQQLGLRVVRTDSVTVDRKAAEVARYRVGANDVYVYLIGHDTSSTGELHLVPRLVVPPPAHGVPHLHRAAHILVLCVTSDWRFAQQLDALVRRLDTKPGSGRSSFAGVAWMPDNRIPIEGTGGRHQHHDSRQAGPGWGSSLARVCYAFALLAPIGAWTTQVGNGTVLGLSRQHLYNDATRHELTNTRSQ